MIDILVRILINAVALVVAAKIIPDIHLAIGPAGPDWIKIAIVAIVFGLVNAYIKPIVKALSFPLTLATLGLVLELDLIAATQVHAAVGAVMPMSGQRRMRNMAVAL